MIDRVVGLFVDAPTKNQARIMLQQLHAAHRHNIFLPKCRLLSGKPVNKPACKSARRMEVVIRPYCWCTLCRSIACNKLARRSWTSMRSIAEPLLVGNGRLLHRLPPCQASSERNIGARISPKRYLAKCSDQILYDILVASNLGERCRFNPLTAQDG